MKQQQQTKSYAWEKDISSKWRQLKEEDITVLQQSEQQNKLQRKEAIDKFNQSIKRKSLIRYLTVVIDFSSAARKQEYRPNRAIVIKNYLSNFIIDFFDQNPLSCLSFVATFRERAILLSDFIDSPQDHVFVIPSNIYSQIDKLNRFQDFEGNASLQNSLELCYENFGAVPQYAKKEILIIFSSITNCDPGNIFETYDKLNTKSIFVNVISLSAQIFILQKVCQVTKGEFFLAKDQNHFQDLLKVRIIFSFVQRSLVPKETQDEFNSSTLQQNLLVKMAFPSRQLLQIPTLCACHNELRFMVYICPNCLAPSCELASFCKVCSVMAVSAAHLSRTSQHNQSLAKYEKFSVYLRKEVKKEDKMEIDESNQVKDSQQEEIDLDKVNELMKINSLQTIESILLNNTDIFNCSGCSKRLEDNLKNQDLVVCTKCRKFYCLECDIFIHETLLSCPTCQIENSKYFNTNKQQDQSPNKIKNNLQFIQDQRIINTQTNKKVFVSNKKKLLKTKVYENDFVKGSKNHQTLKTAEIQSNNKSSQEYPSGYKLINDLNRHKGNSLEKQKGSYYNKESMYSVKGNHFIKNKQQISQSNCQNAINYGIDGDFQIENFTTQDKSSINQRTNHMTYQTKNGRETINEASSQYQNQSIQSKRRDSNNYFNVQSSQIKDFNYERQMSANYSDMKSRNHPIQSNKSADYQKAKRQQYAQNQSNSLLLNILNLKQLQSQDPNQPTDSAVTSMFDSPHKDKMMSQFEKNKMDSSMNNFFVKRKQTVNSVQNQQQKQAISEIKLSRNLLGVQQYKSTGNANTSFYQKAYRKDFLKQQEQELVSNLGINNSVYMANDNTAFKTIESSSLLNSKPYENLKSSQQPTRLMSAQSQKHRKLNPYQKREHEFQKVYEQKMNYLRENTNSLIFSTELTPTRQFNGKTDISIYKERNDNYKVISNRIKTRAQVTERKFIDKNVKILEKFYDPLRVRLRVMPVSRAPLIQGKNSDFYFIEAVKFSLKGDLPRAIEQLKKGLDLKSNHLLCRFNHGVLMFKLGLIQEALDDFELVHQQYGQKEPSCTFNLIICQIQHGKYEDALQLSQLLIDQLQKSLTPDKELLCDTLRLKGVCSFRLLDAVDSIKCYNAANKIRQELDKLQKEEDVKPKPYSGQDLEYIYINLVIEESRHIFEDIQFQRAVMRTSKSHPNLKNLIFDIKESKRFGSHCNFKTVDQYKKSRNVNIDDSKSMNIVHMESIQKKVQFPKKNQQIKPKQSEKITPINFNWKSPIKNDNKKSDNSCLSTERFNAKINKSPNQKSSFHKKERSLNFSSALKNKSVSPNNKDRKEKISELNLQQHLVKIKGGLNQDLVNYIKEKNLFEIDSDDENITNEELVQKILEKHSLEFREVIGTQNEQSISSMLQEQSKIEFLLTEFNQKLLLKEQEWDREFQKEEEKMRNYGLNKDNEDDFENTLNSVVGIQRLQNKRETVVQKLQKSLLDPEVTPDDVQNILLRDMEDRKLKESAKLFKNPKSQKRLTMRQIEVIRNEYLLNQGGDKQSGVEFGEERSQKFQEIDKILKSLKFFKRFDENLRDQIYNNAELVSLPGQTTIFKQGDIGDKLFIILKGRVAVQVSSPDYGNLPVVVATLNDGEQFGELSLIKLNKLQDHSKQGEIQNLQEKKIEEYARRKATCITVEHTDLLALPKAFTIQLFQPDSVAKKQSLSLVTKKIAGKITTSDFDLAKKEDQDELNQKIQFLQQIPLFEEIDSQLLMPIACNMIPYKFSFGEYIIKEGEVPKGLYIVKSGQCKVASQRIAQRTITNVSGKIVDKKNKDKHPLFNEYDPDNSILNEVKSMKRAFQNDRIFVTNEGDQVKGKLEYQDILVFSQLMPKNYFGGRVLIPFDLYQRHQKLYHGFDPHEPRWYPKSVALQSQQQESDEKYHLKSLLSVIADSGQVEVYMLDKSDMSYLPDFLLRKVFEHIAQNKEPDRPYQWQKICEVKDAMTRWEKFRVKQIEKRIGDKQNRDKIQKQR